MSKALNLKASTGVDAGIIFIGDMDILAKLGADREDWRGEVEVQGTVLDVEPGLYIAEYCIPNTWHGRIDAGGLLNITSGKLAVVDPCYAFDSNWGKALAETKYFRGDIPGAIGESDMGGDGSYDVEIRLRKVKKAPRLYNEMLRDVRKGADNQGYYVKVAGIEPETKTKAGRVLLELRADGMHPKMYAQHIEELRQQNLKEMKKLEKKLKKMGVKA